MESKKKTKPIKKKTKPIKEKPEPVKKKKEPVKKKKGIIVEKDSVPETELDENKYSEKLKNLLTSIKNRSHNDSEVKIRFAWKN